MFHKAELMYLFVIQLNHIDESMKSQISHEISSQSYYRDYKLAMYYKL